MTDSDSNRRDFLTAAAAAAGGAGRRRRRCTPQGSDDHQGRPRSAAAAAARGAAGDVLDADKRRRDRRPSATCFENKAKERAWPAVQERQEVRADQHQGRRPRPCFGGLDGYKKLIDRPDVNYVILATPPGFRPFHLEAAVEAGKHIFTEKPVAVDVAGIRKVLAPTKKRRRRSSKIAAGTQRRHQAGYIETMKRIHDGRDRRHLPRPGATGTATASGSTTAARRG